MVVHLFGIRHHGPGSARSLIKALADLQPDCLLIEGPPEAETILPLALDPAMQAPVALLLYVPEQPQYAVYYPLAEFSPEFQAIQHGLRHAIPIRFMDLPQSHQLAMLPNPGADRPDDEAQDGDTKGVGGQADGGSAAAPPEAADEASEAAGEAGEAAGEASDGLEAPAVDIRRDPLRWLAEAAGDADGEEWWERMVEQRRDSADLFVAIGEAMTALRQATPPEDDKRELLREAFMRQTIRAAVADGFQRIAVVCGAWHVPALDDKNLSGSAPTPALAGTVATNGRREQGHRSAAIAPDAVLLKGLPRVKVEATWVPWTDERLTLASGYGAGVASPGWYQHLWTRPDEPAVHWLTRVARLLREQDLAASSAHIIEGVRLAEALAALRNRSLPGLPELNEATLAVLCHGDPTPMRLIARQLIIGERLGAVPDTTPMVPLQQDLTRLQRRLRLPAEATQRTLDLDLRQANDRERSQLLHRLRLLEVDWGLPQQQTGGARGTFHEIWLLQWRPELAVGLIAAGVWGNTVLTAATARARQLAAEAADLAALTQLVERTLLADLPDAVTTVMDRLQAAVALASDVGVLMAALPPLATIRRYGNVRGTDAALVGQVVHGLVARICIGLPGACASLDDDAAAVMFGLVLSTQTAIGLLDDADHRSDWQTTLSRLADQQGLHGLIAGRAVRLLLDAGHFDAAEAARRLGLALATAAEPAQAAAWIEGFLKDSGQLLVHDESLFGVLDNWLSGVTDEAFTLLVPLVRRTFSSFSAPERRQLGQRVRSGPMPSAVSPIRGDGGDIDQARAEAVLPLIAQLLGIEL